jgi:hypothetical protein
VSTGGGKLSDQRRRLILRNVSVGRNDPCPCGSGKKFKVCCLALSRQADEDQGYAPPSELPARYRSYLAMSIAAGRSREEAELRAAVGLAGEVCISPSAQEDPALASCNAAFATMARFVEENEGGEDEVVAIFLPRLPFDVVLDEGGGTAGDLILERHGNALPEAAHAAIRALVEAEDTVCLVHRTRSGIDLEDVRTGARLPAPEGWRWDEPGLTCRLVRHRGRHVPVDPEPIDDPDDPWHLDSMEEAATAADLLVKEVGIALKSRFKGIAMGEEILEHLMNGERPPAATGRRPEVRNTEGHELVFTTLRWAVTWEAGVREVLAKLDGLDLEEGSSPLTGTFRKTQPPKARHYPGATLEVGTLRLEGGVLSVETNSSERAERLRKKLDKALGKTAAFRSVTSEPLEEAMSKPVDPAAEARFRVEQEKLMALPEVREALAKMGRDHSLAWCDEVIPALGNRRPRTLVKTESGRRKVEAILAEFAEHQARRPDDPSPMDLDLIRRELGLARPE